MCFALSIFQNPQEMSVLTSHRQNERTEKKERNGHGDFTSYIDLHLIVTSQ